MCHTTNLLFPGFPATIADLSPLKPDFKTVKYTLGVASSLSRLVRCIIMIADSVFKFAFSFKGLIGGTYFVSVIRTPVSIYDVKEALGELKKTLWAEEFSTQELVSICTKISTKCGVISKDVFHVVKGLNNVGLLGRRQLWMLGFTPYTVVFASLSFLGRLYNNYTTLATSSNALKKEEDKGIGEEKKIVLKAQIKSHKLALVSTTLDVIGLSVLSFSSFFVPGYLLLGASAAVSLHKSIQNGKHD